MGTYQSSSPLAGFSRVNINYSRHSGTLPRLRHAIHDLIVLMPRIAKPDEPLLEQQPRRTFKEFYAASVVPD